MANTEKNNEDITIATFYHFAKLDNYEDMKAPLLEFCQQNQLKGTILLALEGINATMAGAKENILKFFAFLKQDERLIGINWQESEADFIPFQELKVRLKREIVRLAERELETMEGPKLELKGQALDSQEWDELLKDPEAKIIDTRNNYEILIGKFSNTVNPQTENFRDFSRWFEAWAKDNNIEKEQKIAMYCTGGVRCEKSTAYLRKLDYKNVYQLKGGILNYLKTTKNKSNNWQGNCFVFDDRVALDANLQQVELSCTVCNNLVTTDDLKSLKNITKAKIICSSCQQL